MKLTKKQIQFIADKFANEQVDSMDMDTLIQIAYDQLFDYYVTCNDEELKEEFVNYHNDDEKEWDNVINRYHSLHPESIKN